MSNTEVETNDADFDTTRSERAKRIAELNAELAELQAPLPDEQFLNAVAAGQNLPRSMFPLIPEGAEVEVIDGEQKGFTGTYVAHNTDWGMAVINTGDGELHVPYTWVIVNDTIDDPEVEIPIAPDVQAPVV